MAHSLQYDIIIVNIYAMYSTIFSIESVKNSIMSHFSFKMYYLIKIFFTCLTQSLLFFYSHCIQTLSNGEDGSTSGTSGVFLWEKITELSSAGIVLIVNFAKKIPGFINLSITDQITLLKAACLEIMVGVLLMVVELSLYFNKL